MKESTPVTQAAALRPADDADIDAICTIWHRGWRDGHLGHVPAALLRHRRLGNFRRLVPARLDTTTVATIEAGVVGFVTVHGDEIEQIYVDASARGTGVAAALLAHGETAVSTLSDRAWLAVVAGNIRARRFYERNGWSDAGPFVYTTGTASTTGDATIAVPARRYEKHLTPIAVPPARHEPARPDDRLHRTEGGRGTSRLAERPGSPWRSKHSKARSHWLPVPPAARVEASRSSSAPPEPPSTAPGARPSTNARR
jgi:GNAT superfamily N-acetyltransferase